jgi:hypothetical protein
MPKASADRAQSKAIVYFGSAVVEQPGGNATLPAKLARILAKFDLKHLCQGAWVPVKMHLGGGLGYSTIHPMFVRLLVKAIKEAGGKPFVVEGSFDSVAAAAERGYTAETLGCPIVAAGGPYNSHLVTKAVSYRTLNELKIFGAIWDAPCLVNFSHVKGHGDCGYGGACKNIAMGCVHGETRGKLHGLEGGIDWIGELCSLCGKCVAACDTRAIGLDKKRKRVWISFHDCRYCRHCVLACPRKALVMHDKRGFRHFQEGLALAAKSILESFDPTRVLHINLLANITMFCDCWCMTTPSLVPDIGVMASQDLVAVETASLDAIQVKDLLPSGLIGRRKLGRGKHLFEKIHGKDPYIQIRALERHGVGTANYELLEVR